MNNTGDSMPVRRPRNWTRHTVELLLEVHGALLEWQVEQLTASTASQ